MPCRWEASERPLLVRTVWVRGMRHALLTREELAKGCKTARAVSAKSSDSCGRNASEVAERVCRWLAASRPLTPYGGSLWESPRPQSLDVRSNRARLSPKTPGNGLTCSPIDVHQSVPDTPSVQTPVSPPIVRSYQPSNSHSAVSTRSVSFHSSARPKLHIFMPDTRPLPDISVTDDAEVNKEEDALSIFSAHDSLMTNNGN